MEMLSENIASFLQCGAFAVVLNIMLCLLPQVCELLIVNTIFLSIFFSLWCPALLLSSISQRLDCSVLLHFIKDSSSGCWLKYQANFNEKGPEIQTGVRHQISLLKVTQV